MDREASHRDITRHHFSEQTGAHLSTRGWLSAKLEHQTHTEYSNVRSTCLFSARPGILYRAFYGKQTRRPRGYRGRLGAWVHQPGKSPPDGLGFCIFCNRTEFVTPLLLVDTRICAFGMYTPSTPMRTADPTEPQSVGFVLGCAVFTG